MSVTLDGTTGAFDDYNILVTVVNGGTIGTAGCAITISLDAGRNTGSLVQLGLATSYAIPNTGVTLSFTVASLGAGDSYSLSTRGPGWQDGDVQTALNTLGASQFGVVGWGGGTHIVGNGGGYSALTGGVPGADVSTIEGYLDTLALAFDFTRAFVAARDANPPAAYGGGAETEQGWINAVNADFTSVSAKRIVVGAANWNMPSAYPNIAAGTPRYRRNINWAAAARTAAVPPQRHLGRVKDGSLSQIVVSPNDQTDGFVYHNESNLGGLDYKFTGAGGRFMTTTLRKGQPGVFITNPLLMSPVGSDFWMLPFGRVMDVACSIVHQVGEQFINDDIRLNPNGTIFENDARFIEATILNAINSNMLAQSMISPGATVLVNRSNNVQSSGQVIITVSIVGRGYILSESISIGFASASAAT